ncbi:hypothetical protein AHiyo4_27290 [Arthrobacter sp. Hiyo4]|nr:hypothetical protein AHiyo4_27290 [Arthrobacter sp. Hiyo4]
MGVEPVPNRKKVFRRLAHPRRTWAFLAGCLVVAGLAFGLGTLVRSADATVLDARSQTIPVYATVDSRAVSDDVRIQGEIVGSDSYSVHAQIPEGASRGVVTHVAVQQGAALTNGTLIGAVSDRPIFVFSLDAPLFRDIRAKDTGTDVASLQKALGVSLSGVMDWQTQEAVRRLYAEAEFVPPGGWREGHS